MEYLSCYCCLRRPLYSSALSQELTSLLGSTASRLCSRPWCVAGRALEAAAPTAVSGERRPLSILRTTTSRQKARASASVSVLISPFLFLFSVAPPHSEFLLPSHFEHLCLQNTCSSVSLCCSSTVKVFAQNCDK